jgi:hypothetical protein
VCVCVGGRARGAGEPGAGARGGVELLLCGARAGGAKVGDSGALGRNGTCGVVR